MLGIGQVKQERESLGREAPRHPRAPGV